MSHWNYRILSEVVGDYTEYYVAEVHYDNDGNPKNWTHREGFNALRGWDHLEDLLSTIQLVQEAASKPVMRVFDNKLVEQ